MSHLFAFIVALVALSYTQAHILPAIGGPPVLATNALHACQLLAVPDATNPNAGRLATGSIVSRNRVLTAAHVVANVELVRATFFINNVTDLTNRRRTNSIWIQTMFGFNDTSRENDLAIILFQNNIFPLANVIPIANATAAANSTAFLAGLGFTDEDFTAPSIVPLLANHTVAAACQAPLPNATATHFCAQSVAPAIVCPGDTGAGLWVAGANNTKSLIGVVSRLSGTRCSETAAQSAFTNVANAMIQLFLNSQGILTG